MTGQSIIKKSVLAGLGIFSMTREKAQGLVQDFIKQGELSQDEGSKFVKAMLEKADEEMTLLKKLVDNRINETIEKFKPSYENELKTLTRKVDKLTKEVEKLAK